jgi:hypothetical protein
VTGLCGSDRKSDTALSVSQAFPLSRLSSLRDSVTNEIQVFGSDGHSEEIGVARRYAKMYFEATC